MLKPYHAELLAISVDGSWRHQAFPITERLQKSLQRDIRFVFRHFPMTESHPEALNAVRAAESAGLQGKYWQMHALLFRNQDRLDMDGLVEMAFIGNFIGRFSGAA